MAQKPIGEENSLLQKYSGIISLIQFFAETNRWGMIDRMALAMSPDSVETALYDMKRLARSLDARKIRVKIVVREKTYELYCCEYGEDLGYGMYGHVETVLEGPKTYEGKKIYCVPCPRIPSSEETENFLNEVRKDLSLARRVALIGLGSRGKSESRGE